MITSAPFVAANVQAGRVEMQLMGLVIDGPEFARRGNRVGGQVAVAELSRLAEHLDGHGGLLDCEVRGGRNADGSGHLELHLTVSGELQLRCQRCLEAMRFPLRIDKRLRLVTRGEAWPEEDVEDENLDALEASREMAVGSLVEDEVLLALPISPRHEACGMPRTMNAKQDASPFAVLRNLKND